MSDQTIRVRIVLARGAAVPRFLPRLMQVGQGEYYFGEYPTRERTTRKTIDIHRDAEVGFGSQGVTLGRPYFTRPTVILSLDDVLMIVHREYKVSLNHHFCLNCVENSGVVMSEKLAADNSGDAVKLMKCGVCDSVFGHVIPK